MKLKVLRCLMMAGVMMMGTAMSVSAEEYSYSNRQVFNNVSGDFHYENTYHYSSEDKSGEHKIIFKLDSAYVNIDGKKVAIDEAPYINNGRTMLPLRAVTETLKAFENSINVSWNSADKKVLVTYGNDKIVFTVGSEYYTLNGKKQRMDGGVPEIKNDRLFIPLRVVAESMNLDIDWDSRSKSIIVRNG